MSTVKQGRAGRTASANGAGTGSLFDDVPSAIEAVRRGGMVLVVDDEERENEGDLIMAAEKVTPESINFFTKFARGLICVPMTGHRLDELGLGPMVQDNTAKMSTAFTVSVDAVHGTTTGISAPDRAHTIRVLCDSTTRPDDLERPGHIFPLRARDGGVLRRAGHTEAAADLARLAGLSPAGVLCEVMADDGSMARTAELVAIARTHSLPIITIKALIEYRRSTERLIERLVSTRFPTKNGEFTLYLYEEVVENFHHVALVKGDVVAATQAGEAVMVRVHSECLTGDVFHSMCCDCGQQLADALERIETEGLGVLLYLAQEGRGIGLLNKLRAYKLQEDGLDTVDANLELGLPADLRDYGIGAQILVDLGLRRINILTNNPKKIVGMEGYGLEVADQIPIEQVPGRHNLEYLRAKRDKLGHMLHHQGLPLDEQLFREEREADRRKKEVESRLALGVVDQSDLERE